MLFAEYVDRIHLTGTPDSSTLQELFSPIVKRLGIVYSDEEDIDLRQLRTVAIRQAAQAGDNS